MSGATRIGLTVVALALAALLFVPWIDGAGPAGPTPAPRYGEAFWKHWGDGRAELAGYELSFPRYGESRGGTAVTIFVTESFSESARVKAEDPDRNPADTNPVLKLNLIQDFPTGVYDYNLMTSTFIGLESIGGRPAGVPTKVSFSSQEWCGHVYAQLLFDAKTVHHEWHSYFEGEADGDERLSRPDGSLAEDALLLWARGLAAPVMKPGERRELSLLRSLQSARIEHRSLDWRSAVVSRSERTERIRVPAGEFEVDVLRVATGSSGAAQQGWTFFVEAAAPHRLIRWSRSDGYEAELLADTRVAYWSMNGAGFERALEQLGLQPRPPRTP